jgi:hypothetical protein
MNERFIEKKVSKRKEYAKKAYQKQIEAIDAHAQRMEVGLGIILDNFPSIDPIIKSGEFSVEYMKSEGYVGNMTGLDALVRLGKGKNEQVLAFEFNDRDYPTLGIKKGYTIRSCSDPKNYKDVISFYGKPELWGNVEPGTTKFAETVGIGLYGLVEELTRDEKNGDLEKCLRYFKQQMDVLLD